MRFLGVGSNMTPKAWNLTAWGKRSGAAVERHPKGREQKPPLPNSRPHYRAVEIHGSLCETQSKPEPPYLNLLVSSL